MDRSTSDGPPEASSRRTSRVKEIAHCCHLLMVSNDSGFRQCLWQGIRAEASPDIDGTFPGAYRSSSHTALFEINAYGMNWRAEHLPQSAARTNHSRPLDAVGRRTAIGPRASGRTLQSIEKRINVIHFEQIITSKMCK